MSIDVLHRICPPSPIAPTITPKIAHPRADENNQSHCMNKPRILVVDDDVGVSGLVRFLLNKTGRFEVLVENRSANALAVAKEFRPDMLLLDVDMPGKDGGDVAMDMQSDSELHSVPIVFLTSLVPRTDGGEHSVMRGGMPFLSKPVSLKVLLETVDRVLSGRGIPAA